MHNLNFKVNMILLLFGISFIMGNENRSLLDRLIKEYE